MEKTKKKKKRQEKPSDWRWLVKSRTISDFTILFEQYHPTTTCYHLAISTTR